MKDEPTPVPCKHSLQFNIEILRPKFGRWLRKQQRAACCAMAWDWRFSTLLVYVAGYLTVAGLAVCIGTPFDIALVRLQADGMAKPEDRRHYKNVFDVSGAFEA